MRKISTSTLLFSTNAQIKTITNEPTKINAEILRSMSAIFVIYFLNPMRKPVLPYQTKIYPIRASIFPNE